MMAHLITREDWEEYVREEAMELGREQGIELGEKRGKELGKQEAKKETAFKMLEQGIAVDVITAVTDLEADEILSLEQADKKQ